MTGTKPTHIVVRSFRGHQLYLTAFNSVGFLFDWSSKRENAVRVSHGVALELVEKASRQYGAKCAAEDADGVLSQGMVAQQVQQQQAKAASERLYVCPVYGCTRRVIPTKYDGRPGISISRFHDRLVICSECGIQESFHGKRMMKANAHQTFVPA